MKRYFSVAVVALLIGAFGALILTRSETAPHPERKVTVGHPAAAIENNSLVAMIESVSCGSSQRVMTSLDGTGTGFSDPGVVLQYVQSLPEYSFLADKFFLRADMPDGTVVWTYNQNGLNKAIVTAVLVDPGHYNVGSLIFCDGLS